MRLSRETEERLNRSAAELIPLELRWWPCRLVVCDTCTECYGSGRLGSESDSWECPHCGGSGSVEPYYFGPDFTGCLNSCLRLETVVVDQGRRRRDYPKWLAKAMAGTLWKPRSAGVRTVVPVSVLVSAGPIHRVLAVLGVAGILGDGTWEDARQEIE